MSVASKSAALLEAVVDEAPGSGPRFGRRLLFARDSELTRLS